MKKKFCYIYGPVLSWRLGISLGIDLLSAKEKICNFDCIYCQLGRTAFYTRERKIYVPTERIIEELKRLPFLNIDYITFSGRGEPTLAGNLGQSIQAIKKIRPEAIAVLTNASLLNTAEVALELALADFVTVKLDAYSQESFNQINKPPLDIKFSMIFEAINSFRLKYKGKLGFQIMFFPENENKAAVLASICKKLKPDVIHLNTPLRPSAAIHLSESQMLKIKGQFKGPNIISVYDPRPKEIVSLSIGNTKVRRGRGSKST
jgi:wyosine [tRNA(Phe)-imidazoG37] synthetase (radical SAM superfamily)